MTLSMSTRGITVHQTIEWIVIVHCGYLRSTMETLGVVTRGEDLTTVGVSHGVEVGGNWFVLEFVGLEYFLIFKH